MHQIAEYIQASKAFHSRMYKSLGSNAQRKFPAEDVIRFASSHLNKEGRVDILDIGCAFGVNTASLASMSRRWNVKGVDFCPEAIDVANTNSGHENLTYEVDTAPYLLLQEKGSRDVIVDHMCSYGLRLDDLEHCMMRYRYILRAGGLLYVKTLSDRSDLIKDFPADTLIEERTLSRIKRENAPFPNDDYLFRFTNKDELTQIATKCGLTCKSMELRARTYRNMLEYYEQLDAVFEAV